MASLLIWVRSDLRWGDDRPVGLRRRLGDFSGWAKKGGSNPSDFAILLGKHFAPSEVVGGLIPGRLGSFRSARGGGRWLRSARGIEGGWVRSARGVVRLGSRALASFGAGRLGSFRRGGLGDLKPGGFGVCEADWVRLVGPCRRRGTEVDGGWGGEYRGALASFGAGGLAGFGFVRREGFEGDWVRLGKAVGDGSRPDASGGEAPGL